MIFINLVIGLLKKILINNYHNCEISHFKKINQKYHIIFFLSKKRKKEKKETYQNIRYFLKEFNGYYTFLKTKINIKYV